MKQPEKLKDTELLCLFCQEKSHLKSSDQPLKCRLIFLGVIKVLILIIYMILLPIIKLMFYKSTQQICFGVFI